VVPTWWVSDILLTSSGTVSWWVDRTRWACDVASSFSRLNTLRLRGGGGGAQKKI
jgi:hypothetical protein